MEEIPYWICPKCGKKVIEVLGWHTLTITTRVHYHTCKGVDTVQKDLFGNAVILKGEVKEPMGKIPKERLAGTSNILKPNKLGKDGSALAIGSRMTFKIRAPHTASETGLLSVPVTYSNGLEGAFPLNRTHTTMFVDVLGDDSDTWVGASFEAVCVPQKNVSTGQPTLGWSVLRETITKPKTSKN